MIAEAHHHLWQPERGYEWLQAPGLDALRRPFTPQDLLAALPPALAVGRGRGASAGGCGLRVSAAASTSCGPEATD
jgi:hypothetical protein